MTVALLDHADAVTDPDEGFDYGALDDDTRKFVQSMATDIRTHGRRACEGIISVGQALIDVNNRLGHGHFSAWLCAEFGWSDRQARRFMTAAERYQGKTDIVSAFDPTALYELSADATPAEVRKHFDAKAAAGERVTTKEVKEAKAEARSGDKAPRPSNGRTEKRTARRPAPDPSFARLLTLVAGLREYADEHATDGLADSITMAVEGHTPDDERPEIADVLLTWGDAFSAAGHRVRSRCTAEAGAAPVGEGVAA